MYKLELNLELIENKNKNKFLKGYWHLNDSGFPDFLFLPFDFPYFLM